MMTEKDSYLKFIIDQLSDFGQVDIKKMFGGAGVFHKGLMFGMIASGTLRLKVDDLNKLEFEARGMKEFFSKSKKKSMPYWEVPIDIIEDKEELSKWATKSYEAAVRNAK